MSCGFPGILLVFLVGEEVQWEGWPARRDTGGEWLSYVLKFGVICSRGNSFPGVPATLDDTLQIRLLLRKCMLSHIQSTHHQGVSSLSLQPGFSGAGLYQLVPQKCGENASWQSPPIQTFHQMGHFSLSCQLLRGLNPAAGWEAVLGH